MKWPDWTGLGERTYKQSDGEVVQPSKTAWDWLQLLIVPAVLVGAVTLYNQVQTNQANTRQENKRLRTAHRWPLQTRTQSSRAT